MGSLYKRGDVWWCKYYVDGRPVRESTKATAADEARRFLKLREGRVAAGAALPPRADRVLFDELADDLVAYYRTTGRWKNLDDVEDRLAYLRRQFTGWRAVKITPAALTAYVERRQREKTRLGRLTSNRTVNLELALLRRMFRLARDRRKVVEVPRIEMLEEAAPRAGFFEAEQYRAVARHLAEDLRVAVAIAHTFGWRVRSEVLPLERRHVDLKAGTLRLEPGTTKNRDGRVVYVTPELRTALEGQLARVDKLSRELGRIIPYVFPHPKGPHRGERRRGFRKAWRLACAAAGVPGRLLHDFRRTAVRNMERAGVPRAVAMKLTGHRTEAVYRRYAIVSDADLQDAARRLSAGAVPSVVHVDA